MKKKRKRKREEGVCGLARRLLGWSFPGRPSSCPFSFFLFKTFSFLFSGLSYNFFILAPNELKPVSKFF
jgi:hypothetical protein